MSYKNILDNVSNIENLENVTILKTLKDFEKYILKNAKVGPAGPQGKEGPIGPQGPQGIQGVQGIQGLQGEKGASGNDFTIKGYVSSNASLPVLTASDVGTAYLVGTTTPRLVYLWGYDELGILGWSNQGYLQGPVGPQGPQGVQGIQGPAGPSGSNLSSFNFQPKSSGITYQNGKFNVEGRLSFTAGSYSDTIDATIVLPIEASEDIIVDINENNNALIIELDQNIINAVEESVKSPEMLLDLIGDSTSVIRAIDNNTGKLMFYLDATITSKLARTLVTPLVAPNSLEVVCIDDLNSQVNLELSDEFYANGNTLGLSDKVEKVDPLYDMNSNSSALNWGYTSGMPNETTVNNKNFNKYKYLNVYCRFYGEMIFVKVDLSILTANNNYAGGNTSLDNGITGYDNIIIRVNSAKTSLEVVTKRGVTSWGTPYAGDVFVYKIEGVY